jgi:hypothetical protein
LNISDSDVETEYFKESGGQDSGLDMLTSLNEWRQNGWIAAGKLYNIHSYAQLDITKQDELKYCAYLLRGAYIGIQVPQSAMDQFNAGQPWTVVSGSPTVGGHCIYIKAFNPIGPVCMTWGAQQQMTWDFYETYCDEAYGVIDNTDSWVDPSTDPLNIPLMDQELSEITSNSPNPQPSPCAFGNVVARFFNFFAWLFHRRGRFAYLKDKKEAEKNA